MLRLSVRGMLDVFIKALGAGIELVALVEGARQAELTARGCPDTVAQELRKLYRVYFGATTYTGMQRKSLHWARKRGHSLTTLLAIEKKTDQIKNKEDKWRLRMELLRARGDASDISRLGARRVAALKALKKKKKRVASVKIRRFNDNTSELKVVGPAAQVNEMYDAVKRADNPYRAFRKLFVEGGGVSTVLTPMIVIHLDQLDKILSGDGEEVELQLTNGAKMTGLEFTRSAIGEFGYVTILHPVKGPVNTYYARFANAKQRIMAAAENPVCAWEDCTRPADECQVHHLLPHSLGGQTKPENLVTCCAYHNGVNDDDPFAPSKYGRLERVFGGVKRVWKAA